eukprot:sb/3471296/
MARKRDMGGQRERERKRERERGERDRECVREGRGLSRNSTMSHIIYYLKKLYGGAIPPFDSQIECAQMGTRHQTAQNAFTCMLANLRLYQLLPVWQYFPAPRETALRVDRNPTSITICTPTVLEVVSSLHIILDHSYNSEDLSRNSTMSHIIYYLKKLYGGAIPPFDSQIECAQMGTRHQTAQNAV